MPIYERVDLRVNKVFNRDHYRFTVHAEVANVLDHTNWRYYNLLYPPTVQCSGSVDAVRNKIMPVLPTAGLTVEF